jgi:prepilin-type processing-associated H-X9-DG protein
MTRITMVSLLLLAICSGAWAGGPAQSTDYAALLSGDSIPLTLKLSDLDGSWRRFKVTGDQEPDAIYAAMYGVAGAVYYSKGQTVSVTRETYLVAYGLQAKMPTYATTIMRRGAPPEPEKLTAASPVALCLLNVRTMGNLADIRPFDRDAEIAAYLKLYEDLSAAMVSETSGEPSQMGNLKNVALAIQMFMADYDTTPPMKTPEAFRGALDEYVKNQDVFKDPETGEYYAINTSISDKSMSEITDPGKIVAVYEAQPGDDGKRGVAFLDGHVQRVSDDEWKRLRDASGIIEVGVAPVTR